MSAVTKEDICTPGYSKFVRHVPEGEKKQVYQEYNMQPHKSPCPCEVDHLVSLELGSSNDIQNLWPQSFRCLERPYERSLGKLAAQRSMQMQYDLAVSPGTKWTGR